jgi:hypothetical protein
MNALIVFLLVLSPVACRTADAAAQQAAPPAAPAQHSHISSSASGNGDGYLQLSISEDKGDLLLVMHGDRFTGILDGEVLPPERLVHEGDKLTVIGADGSALYVVRVDSKHHSLVYPYDAKAQEDWTFSDDSDPFGVGGNWPTGATVWRGGDRKLIGVTTSPLDAALRAQLGVDGDAVVIESVSPDMPAAKAGVQPFDVVTAIEGQPGASPERLRNALDDKQVGDKLKLTVLRRGQSQELELTIEKAKPSMAYAVSSGGMPQVQYRTLMDAQAGNAKAREELLAKLAAVQAETEKLSAAQSGESAKQLAELAKKQAEIAEELKVQAAAAQAGGGNYLGVIQQNQDGGSRWVMLPANSGRESVGVGGSSGGVSPDRLAQIEDRLARLEALLERLAPPAGNDTSKSGGASGSKP